MHTLTSRHRRAATLAALALTTAAAAAPGTAHAACSTAPTAQSFSDAFADEGTGNAPDIVSLNIAIDAACTINVGAGISNQSALENGDFIGWFLNTDGNTATGSPSGFVGADWAIARVAGAAQLLPWSSTSAQFVDGPVISTAGLFGVAFNLEGYVPFGPRTITIAGGTSWTSTATGNRYYDWAPEPGLAPFALPLNLTQPAPPAPVTTPMPSGGTQNEAICTVPRSKGLPLGRVKAKVRAAGCTLGAIRRERSTRIPRGRVIRLSQPTYAFVQATQPLRIIVSSGPGPNGRAKRASIPATTGAELAAFVNSANARAAR